MLAFFPVAGQAQTASSWAQGLHSKIRLVAGGQKDGYWLSGIEIALDPGYKTYWRTPGDSGLPPRFDWSGSENLAAIDLKWPAPSRQEDAGGVAYAYHDDVVLPLLVTPKDAGKPVRLALSVDYGVCKDICIPAHAEIAATLTAGNPPSAELEEALTRLPQPRELSAPGRLSVLAVGPLPDKPGFTVKVRAPEGSKPALFAEGPDDWYLSTSLPDAENRFTVTVDEKPANAKGPVPIRLTLAAGDEAIETKVTLDADKPPR